jgi:acid phosphatase
VRTVLALVAAVASLGVAAQLQPQPPLAHIVVIVFENHEYSSIIGNAQAPTFNELARDYATLTNYRAVAHPSLPNYIALASGATYGITSDCTTCRLRAQNLVDALDKSGKTWKVYAEGLPYAGYTGASAGLYAKKHNPFLYFRDIADNPSRRQNVVPLGELRADSLPDFAFVVPNACHSMHDCPVRAGDRWLHAEIGPLLQQPQTAVFVVFDEGTTSLGGGGHVPAVVAGTAVRPHSRFTPVTSHYGLLRTVEDAWDLEHLGRSKAARPITGIWR